MHIHPAVIDRMLEEAQRVRGFWILPMQFNIGDCESSLSSLSISLQPLLTAALRAPDTGGK